MHLRAFDGITKLLPFQYNSCIEGAGASRRPFFLLTPMDHSSQQFFFFCLVSDG